MCRLLGVVSPTASPLERVLDDVLPPFTELSCMHKDGWGVAAADGAALTVTKEPTRASMQGSFGDAIRATVSDAALVHLRLASPTLAVVPGNTHPFVHSGVAFAHNGSAEPIERIWPMVDPDLRGDLEGDTDSEAYFRALLTTLRREPPESALRSTAARLREECAVTGLNCLLLTPDALWAYCEHDPTTPSLMQRPPDYFPLRYRVTEDGVVVSSTGFEQPSPAWQTLPEQHTLRVGRRSAEVTVYAP